MNTTEPGISFIIPYFKRFDQFKKIVFRNFVFQDPRCEVVLVLDEPTEEKQLLEEVIVPLSSRVRFRVVVNDKDHAWRPPCAAINVGIRNSLGQHCAVLSPESSLLLPRRDYLYDVIADTKGDFYLTGFFLHLHDPAFEQIDDFQIGHYVTYNRFNPEQPYGFILFKKEDAFRINGYDERRQTWGGDDDDFRVRLEAIGVRRIQDKCIKVLHLWGQTANRGKAEPFGQDTVIPGQESFGTDFSRIAFDWTTA